MRLPRTRRGRTSSGHADLRNALKLVAGNTNIVLKAGSREAKAQLLTALQTASELWARAAKAGAAAPAAITLASSTAAATFPTAGGTGAAGRSAKDKVRGLMQAKRRISLALGGGTGGPPGLRRDDKATAPTAGGPVVGSKTGRLAPSQPTPFDGTTRRAQRARAAFASRADVRQHRARRAPPEALGFQPTTRRRRTTARRAYASRRGGGEGAQRCGWRGPWRPG